ncbi:hypothetical protein HMN09_00213000 [Mycena chlorophos]|uniref:Uncharacterized protein n=1 Tax=Mycena chlorophos TaxID=658473 RepID=A0A8H6WJT7_MYCCL|nr:hypothetical protein HMN09_00213000 [Mycena chlorophos]
MRQPRVKPTQLLPASHSYVSGNAGQKAFGGRPQASFRAAGTTKRTHSGAAGGIFVWQREHASSYEDPFPVAPVPLAKQAFAAAVSARVNLVDRLSACRDAGTLKVLGNATLTGAGTSGHTAHFSATYCPAPDSDLASTSSEEPSTVNKRQTCTQCPCANGSITCYCHTLGSQNSLFIDTCTNSTPPAASIPVGAPSGSLGFPAQTNGYYNVPVNSILSWTFQGCAFAFFNDVGTTYNICAQDLQNTVRALNGFCDDVNNNFGLFQNNGRMSCMTYNPAELG